MKTPYNTPIEKSSVNPMCPDCARFGKDCEGTACQTWTGCIYKQRTDPAETICKPKLIYQPDAPKEARYNVQLWHSYDGGKTFYYAGYGRFFDNQYDAEAWRKQQRKNLAYDLMFGRLGNGTTVFNLAREEYGDYQNVAHIDDCGTVRWYVDTGKLPPYVLEDVSASARRDAEKFKENFLRMDRSRALEMLGDLLNVGQFLIVFHEENIADKGMEEIYQAYIKYVCKNGKRTMPAA